MPLRPVLFICAALLLAAALAAPLAPAIQFAFSAVCHQTPARCFPWLGGTMPVCARCVGVYSGLLAAALMPLRVPPSAIWALAGLNAADWLLGAAPNTSRYLLAFAFCWFAASELIAFASRECTASH